MSRSSTAPRAGVLLAALCALAAGPAASHGEPADAACGVLDCGAEESGLLQVQRRGGRDALERGHRQSVKAVTFEGGGFHAFSSHTGLIAGLLASFPDGAGSLDQLLAEYWMISSNSGGSWYAASLIYSDYFVNLTNVLAAKPTSSGPIFKTTWVAGLLSLQNWGPPASSACNSSALVEKEKEKAESSRDDELSSRQKESLSQLAYTMWHGNLTWTTYVTEMLVRASRVPEGATLGSDVMPWASGKDWMACVSVPTPDHSKWVAPGQVWDYAVEDDKDAGIYSRVFSDSTKDFGMYTPAKFSAALGSEDENPPYPFCAEPGCFEFKAVYKRDGTSDEVKTEEISGLFNSTFTSKLSVGSVASSSSAFGGAAIMNSKPASKLSTDCLDLGTWVSRRPDGLSFQRAAEVRSTAWATHGSNFDEFPSETVIGVIDGGYTDNSGVAWAVGSGATEVVAFVTTFASLQVLFSGADEKFGVCPACSLYFQIFNKSAAEAQAEYDAFLNLTLPSDDFHYLTQLKLGTVKTTTVDNKWFGVKAGIDVTLHVMSVETQHLRIGGSFTMNSFFDYGTLVQEITSTMVLPENAPAVQDALSEWFSVAK